LYTTYKYNYFYNNIEKNIITNRKEENLMFIKKNITLIAILLISTNAGEQ
tara:strand:+ start:444 stop:593 length:150 start_codon:yes stop_codon:yes gene_type:complete